MTERSFRPTNIFRQYKLAKCIARRDKLNPEQGHIITRIIMINFLFILKFIWENYKLFLLKSFSIQN